MYLSIKLDLMTTKFLRITEAILYEIEDLFALAISCLFNRVLLVDRIESQKHPCYGTMPSITSIIAREWPGDLGTYLFIFFLRIIAFPRERIG